MQRSAHSRTHGVACLTALLDRALPIATFAPVASMAPSAGLTRLPQVRKLTGRKEATVNLELIVTRCGLLISA